MDSIDKTTVKFLQNLHWYINVLKFVLGFIPSFDDKTAAMKNKVDEIPCNTEWEFLTNVPFKTSIKQHQYCYIFYIK